jgi:methionine-rich copper-binding protein CopC
MSLYRASAVLGALLGVLVLTSVAFAHAAYERSTPTPGQVLTTPPTRVEIFTKQDMRRQAGANVLTVADERGTRVDTNDVAIEDANRRHMTVGLRPGLPAGRYVVSFQTLSDEDGETDKGSFAFYVGSQPTDAQKAQDAQLQLTTASADGDAGSSSLPLIIAAIVVVVLIAAIGIGGWLVFRNRRPAA